MIRRQPRSTRTDTLFPYRRSSDLLPGAAKPGEPFRHRLQRLQRSGAARGDGSCVRCRDAPGHRADRPSPGRLGRSEEHTSELQSLMSISYDVFCLKKKKNMKNRNTESTRLHDNVAARKKEL